VIVDDHSGEKIWMESWGDESFCRAPFILSTWSYMFEAFFTRIPTDKGGVFQRDKYGGRGCFFFQGGKRALTSILAAFSGDMSRIASTVDDMFRRTRLSLRNRRARRLSAWNLLR